MCFFLGNFAVYFSKMIAARNQLLSLLETDFLSRTVRKTVLRYVSRKAIPSREYEDVEMAVIEKFINQKQQIVTSFEGKAQPSTYCIAIVNRMCCEVIRKEWKHWQAVGSESSVPDASFYQASESQTDHVLLVGLELERLQSALNSLQETVPSAEILLLLHFELKPGPELIKKWARADAEKIREKVEKMVVSNKTERYQLMAKLLSEVEVKKIKPDALRMRIYKYMDTLIDLLNRNDQSQHTRETLKLLFEIRMNNAENEVNPPTKKKLSLENNLLLFIVLNGLPWIV